MKSTIPQRHTIRLQNYDYASEGLYFVTICAEHRMPLFGNIVDAKVELNKLGSIIDDFWREMFRFIEGYETRIVMPNHVHGIVAIADDSLRVAPGKPLGRQVGAFKTITTKSINMIRRTPGEIVWQRNFYEHIIRDEQSFDRVVAYIHDNPAAWDADPENPVAQMNDDARETPRIR